MLDPVQPLEYETGLFARISLHFMLSPVQPLEYETGLFIHFLLKQSMTWQRVIIALREVH